MCKRIIALLLSSLMICFATGCNNSSGENLPEQEAQTTKDNNETNETESTQMEELFGCQAEKIQSGLTDKKIMELYTNALERGKTEGYTPVIVSVSDLLTSTIESNYDSFGGADEFRGNVLSAYELAGKELLSGRYDELMEFGGEEDFSANDEEIEELLSQPNGDRSYMPVSRFEDLYLVYVPTEKPYEIFAWLPFGGWNECPSAEEMIYQCRIWYEKYGAVPSFISSDMLMLYLSEPVTDISTAKEIARDHCVFCSDYLYMGGINEVTVGVLNANVWAFWWD